MCYSIYKWFEDIFMSLRVVHVLKVLLLSSHSSLGMSSVERPVGFLIRHLLIHMKLHGIFFCPLDCTLGPYQDPGCRVLIPPMFLDGLSPKPVLLLAAQGQEVLKYSRCCVLLGWWCPLWMRATLGCCRRARFLLFAACLLPRSVVPALSSFGESLENWGFWQSWLLDPEQVSLTLCELGIFAPFVVLGGD